MSPYAAPLLTPVLLPIGGVRHKILTRSMRFLYTPPTGEPQQRRGGRCERERCGEARRTEGSGDASSKPTLFPPRKGGNDAAALT